MNQWNHNDNLVIGESSGTLRLESLSDFCSAIDMMAVQSARCIKLFTQELDHELYDRSDLVDALMSALKRKKDQQLSILLKEANRASKLGHRLVELQKRIPSKVEIRSLPAEYQDMSHEYMIVDDMAMVKRFAVGYMRGHCEFRSVPDAAKYSRQFNDIWQRSLPCQELRSVHL